MSPNLYFKYKYTKPKLDVCYDKLPMRHNPFSFQKIKKKTQCEESGSLFKSIYKSKNDQIHHEFTSSW